MQLTLYTKPDCPLCDELKSDLADLQQEIGFALEECNILEDERLVTAFQYLIPVLEIDGAQLLYPPHDWMTLYNTLHAARLRTAQNRTAQDRTAQQGAEADIT